METLTPESLAAALMIGLIGFFIGAAWMSARNEREKERIRSFWTSEDTSLEPARERARETARMRRAREQAWEAEA